MARRTGMPSHLKPVTRPPFIELTHEHVGKALLRAFGRSWSVSEFIGRILPQDIGKRVYRISCDGGSFVLQVENDAQRAKRLGNISVNEIAEAREEKRRAWRIARVAHYARTRSTMALAQMLVALEDHSGAKPEFDIDEEWPS